MSNPNNQKSAIQLENCSNVTIEDNKSIGYDNFLNAKNVKNLNADRNKVISADNSVKWYKKSENIIAMVAIAVTIIIAILW